MTREDKPFWNPVSIFEDVVVLVRSLTSVRDDRARRIAKLTML
jgi:hypothetical protein